jgi:hypothetical protein
MQDRNNMIGQANNLTYHIASQRLVKAQKSE